MYGCMALATRACVPPRERPDAHLTTEHRNNAPTHGPSSWRGGESPIVVERGPSSDEALLDRLQRAAFGYFLEAFNPVNGLIADRSRAGSPASIAVVGFALASYPVAVERGWMSRSEAAARTLASLRFFWSSPQSDSPDATGYKGFYYHFLDMQTGRRVWQSELSPVDTTFLLAGMLTADAYFTGDTPQEIEIRELADFLYRRVEWPWMQNGATAVWQGWKPESGYLHYGWEGYSEAMLLYVLGMASPTYPLADTSYEKWTSTYQWENLYGYDFLYAGPLFIHQFSQVWLDLRDLQDRFMSEKRCDYFENSRRAAYIQQQYALRNPHEFEGYGENFWALSAGDGPGRKILRINGRNCRFFDYVARGVPHGPDDGTITPPAILASLPFAPELVLPAIRHLRACYPQIADEYRLHNGFNPTLSEDRSNFWISEGYLGLDQGVITLMIENHRSRLIWNLMRECPHIKLGLRRAGFKGGWLSQRVAKRAPRSIA